MSLLINRILPFILLLLFIDTGSAHAFWGSASKSVAKIASISVNKMVLSENEIIRLSELSTMEQGTKKVGKELGKLNLPNEVLEDTYIRIAIHQEKLSRKEAESMYSSLSNVPGFRTTLRKITGNSAQVTAGHLNELKISHYAAMNGYKVLHIGEIFSDGIKSSPTDIDIKLSKDGKIIIIEAKDYLSTSRLPLDKYRSDLNTLVEYKKQHPNENVITIFSITNKPNDPQYIKRLEYEAEKRNVQLIFGAPDEQLHKINVLSDIL